MAIPRSVRPSLRLFGVRLPAGTIGVLSAAVMAMMLLPPAGAFPTGATAKVSAALKCPHPCYAQLIGKLSTIPNGSKQLLSVRFSESNFEDCGALGCWALATVHHHTQIWESPSKVYYSLYLTQLDWTTFKGALSLRSVDNATFYNATGNITEPKGGSGLALAAEFAVCSGGNLNFTPGTRHTHGWLGNFNDNGTKADVLKRTYANGQTGSVYANPVPTYFTGNCTDTYDYVAAEYFYPTTHQQYVANYNFITAVFRDAGNIVT